MSKYHKNATKQVTPEQMSHDKATKNLPSLWTRVQSNIIQDKKRYGSKSNQQKM